MSSRFTSVESVACEDSSADVATSEHPVVERERERVEFPQHSGANDSGGSSLWRGSRVLEIPRHSGAHNDEHAKSGDAFGSNSNCNRPSQSSALESDPDFFDQDFFEAFTDLFIMAALKVLEVGIVVENIAKLDARLLAMFQSLGLHENVMARLAELGVINITSLHMLVDDRKHLRDFPRDACGADPANGGYKHTVEASNVVPDWE